MNTEIYGNKSDVTSTRQKTFRPRLLERLLTILLRLKILLRFSSMSKLVQIQYDMSCYNLHDSQTCLNLFRINSYDTN